ncbi:DMT family transporter [Peptoniphilus sp. KCTC 25270]|uniref:DMT family transporter n=1 Tax=Peptoniphilus sp. KCTC 25270 TaxID=2897414 RepID=UPI001E429FF3|nr:DMT family transporter [Peptoniphilus sp. KCTC 25270]MCD1147469.1 DMT family transporter [Peptoniphilus sp. KCTC 25270]
MAALISTLEPVVTVLVAIVFLGDPLEVRVLLGGALVLSALFLTMAPSKKEKLLPENTLPDPGDIFSEE